MSAQLAPWGRESWEGKEGIQVLRGGIRWETGPSSQIAENTRAGIGVLEGAVAIVGVIRDVRGRRQPGSVCKLARQIQEAMGGIGR